MYLKMEVDVYKAKQEPITPLVRIDRLLPLAVISELQPGM